MALTRVQVETILVKRCGGVMALATMAVTTAGANADLDDPIGAALRAFAITPANPLAVTDADIAGITNDDAAAFLDVAELRTLESVLGNLQLVDIRLGPRDEKLGQVRTGLEQRIARLEKAIQTRYGLGLGTITAGVIGLSFAEHEDGTSHVEGTL